MITALGFTLPLSAHSCEGKSLAHERIKQISFLIAQYEMEGCDYELDFNYHMGYLRGQIKAFQEVENLLH